MNENILSIWLEPSFNLLSVILGFIATAIFNHSAYTKQINLLEKETEKRFKEIEKQKDSDQQYSLLDKSLCLKQKEIDDEFLANTAYTKLRLEFLRLSSIVREVLERFDEYEIPPIIESNIANYISDPTIIQMNILAEVLDVQIYLEQYNRDCISKEYKKELLQKAKHRLHNGNNDCFEATQNSMIRIQRLREEYTQRIIKFKEDGTIIL